jgi:RNA ligase
MIMNIQDFTDAVKDMKEVGKKESAYWDCFAYNVAFPDTFDNPIVREARGIVIGKDPHGNYDRILRRPFEKFFNLNEREETQYDLLKNREIDYVMEKVDGTMVCPFIDPLTNEVVYGTKRVDDDFHKHIKYVLHVHFPFVKDGIDRILRTTHWSPIFEFHDPDYDPSVIVVKYNRRRVTLLAMRNRETGEYAPHHVLESYAYQFGFELPGFFNERDLGIVVESLKDAKDREGVVVVFKDGMRVKIKCDWYVRRHKVNELFNRRHIMAQLIFECGDVSFDDIAPYIEESDRREFEDFSMELHKTIDKVIFWIKSTASHFETKKDFALSKFGKLPFASLVFKLIEDDSLDPFVLVVDDLKKNINKEINFDRWIERVKSLP